MTAYEIKNDIMAKYDITNRTDVRCSRCAYWGFNNGKMKTNGASSCAKRKGKTVCYNFCRLFMPIEKK